MRTVRKLEVVSQFAAFCEPPWPGVVPVEVRYVANPAGHPEALEGIDVLLGQIFTPEMAARARGLRLIQATGAGIERIQLDVVPPGCVVANVFEHERAIAEWVMMAMVALNREVLAADRTLRRADWSLSYFRTAFPPELSSQTLGIVGLGHIGRQSAALARALGMRVVAATRTVPGREVIDGLGLDYVVDMGEVGRVLAEADFVLVALALTPQTVRAIGAAERAAMQPSSCLINVSRAEVVDEDALFVALETGAIRGAALDVWYREPAAPDEAPWPADRPFWTLDNVLMSPHLSGLTSDMWARRRRVCAENVDRLARGEPLRNVQHRG